MALYTYERYSDAPILLFTASADYDLIQHSPQAVAEGHELLKTESDPVFLINDLSDMIVDVDVLLAGVNMFARDPNSLWHHPKVCGLIMVTSNQMVHLAAGNMNNDMFGNVTIKVFATLDEALAFVRA